MGIKEFLKPDKKKILVSLFILIFIFNIIITPKDYPIQRSQCKLSDPPVCAFDVVEIIGFAHYLLFLLYPVSVILVIVYWFLHRKEENSFDYLTEGVYGFLIAFLYFLIAMILLLLWQSMTRKILYLWDNANLFGTSIITPILGILGIILGYKIYKHTNKMRWKYAFIFSTIFLAIIFLTLILFMIEHSSPRTVETPSYQVICARDVVFNIKSVCKSGNDYKISIENSGVKDIVKWKVRLYEDESKVDVIDSDEGIPMFGIGKITVTPSKINELRKVEVTPTIKTADKEVTCAQNIGFYGDVEGEPITKECE